jgi:hypothetical protein
MATASYVYQSISHIRNIQQELKLPEHRCQKINLLPSGNILGDTNYFFQKCNVTILYIYIYYNLFLGTYEYYNPRENKMHT